MEIVGYSMALLIGVSLGLIGGGGSILAVPVLAYLFGLDEKLATAYSLFVVGSAALVGGFRQYKNGHVDVRTAVVFGAPAVLGSLGSSPICGAHASRCIVGSGRIRVHPSDGNVWFVLGFDDLGGLFHAQSKGAQKWFGCREL